MASTQRMIGRVGLALSLLLCFPGLSQAEQRLRVGSDESLSPYSMRDVQGRPQGFAVEVFREAARTAGLAYEWRCDNTTFMIAGMRTGRLDVIIVPPLATTARFLATRPYHVDHPVVYAPAGTSITSIRGAEATARKWVVSDNEINYATLDRLGFPPHGIPVGSARIALRLVSDGDMDFAVVNRLSALQAIRDYRIRGLVPLQKIREAQSEYRFYVRPDLTNVAARLDAALMAMERDGQLEHIYKQWFGLVDPQPMTLRDFKPYVPAVLMTLVLLASLHLWRLEQRTLALRDEVRARERAQAERRDSEERFRQIAENINEVFWISDTAKASIEYISPAYARVWGRPAEELLANPQGWLEAIHPDDRERIRRAAFEDQVTGRYDVTYRIIRPDHATRWIRDRAFPVRNEAGEVFRIVGIAEDVTEPHESHERIDQLNRSQEEMVARRTAELQSANEALQKSQARIEALLHAIPDMVFRMSKDGTFLDYSAPAGTTHVPPDRIIGQSLRSLGFPDAVVTKSEKANEEALSSGGIVTFEYELEGPKGRQFFEARVVKSGKAEVVAAVRDITDRRRFEEDRHTLESRLFQSQKMEAIGTLAGGIAHDFNNILGAILGYSETLLMSKSTSPEVRETLQEMVKASTRGADMVRQILTFSRRQHRERRAMSLQPIVRESLRFLRSSLPSTIEIQVEIDTATPSVIADPTQIQQVVMNLCTNAAQSMRDRPGRMTVSLREEVPPEGSPQAADLKRGRYVCLSVADTGVGIPEAVLPHIFEPFFTTKPLGEGTGLGLSVVHGIVKDHEGAITVNTRPQVGTTFRIYLPALDAPVATEHAEPTAIQSGHGEHILFIDDEPPMADMGRRLLTQIGYRVTSSSSPQEALELFMATPERFDLVVTDMNMPRLSGVDLARAVHATQAKTPIILISGHLAGEPIPPAEETGIREMLTKPFTARQISAALRRILDRENA